MPKFHPLTVNDIRRETDTCVSVAFEVPADLKEAYRFIPGQYLTLRTMIGSEDIRRSYSICTAPREEDLRVAIKQVPGGIFSNFANEQLKVGDTLQVMTPMGNFRAETAAGNRKYYLAFAAGSGITPIMAILKAVLMTEPQSHFTLFYGNRSGKDIIFRESLEQLKNIYMNRLSIHYIMSREHPGSDLFFGHIDAEKCHTFCDKLLTVAEIDEIFICGPEPMIHSVKASFQERGVDPRHIHFELFTTMLSARKQQKPTIKTGPSVQATIRVIQDGKTFHFPLASDGDTILEAAIKSGADLPFSCRGGVCATCKAKLIEGKVEMDVNYALEPDEVEAGYILTCQSHPNAQKVVVDFDS